jgi:hypothetical protein
MLEAGVLYNSRIFVVGMEVMLLISICLSVILGLFYKGTAMFRLLRNPFLQVNSSNVSQDHMKYRALLFIVWDEKECFPGVAGIDNLVFLLIGQPSQEYIQPHLYCCLYELLTTLCNHHFREIIPRMLYIGII